MRKEMGEDNFNSSRNELAMYGLPLYGTRLMFQFKQVASKSLSATAYIRKHTATCMRALSTCRNSSER